MWADISSHGPYTASTTRGGRRLQRPHHHHGGVRHDPLGAGRRRYLRREGVDGCEFPRARHGLGTGAMFMGEANDLIIVFLGLEIMSIALYVLAA